MKFTEKQKDIILTLRKYPNDIIVNLSNRSFLTGGHGVTFDRRTLESLRNKGLINSDNLTELGKTIQL